VAEVRPMTQQRLDGTIVASPARVAHVCAVCRPGRPVRMNGLTQVNVHRSVRRLMTDDVAAESSRADSEWYLRQCVCMDC
jgi:hypothetical protein